MDASALIVVIVLPLAVSAVTTILLGKWRCEPRAQWAAAVALGYVAGQLALKSRAGIALGFASFVRPHDARDWLPLVVLLAAGATMLNACATAAWWRWTAALCVLLTIAAPLRLVAGNVRLAQQWSSPEKLAYLVLLAATFGLTWLLLAATRDDDVPLLRLLLMPLVAVGAAVVITLSGVIVNGQLCAVVATALAGTVLGSWLCNSLGATGSSSRGLAHFADSSEQNVPVPFLRPRRTNNWALGGAAGVVTMSLGGLVVLGCFYAELTAVNAALLFLSLIAAGGPLPEFLSTGPVWRLVVVRTGLCLTPLMFAIFGSVA